MTQDAHEGQLERLDAGLADQFEDWRQAGRMVVAEQGAEFRMLLSEAERLATTGRHRDALIAAQIAATYAYMWHGGFYASSALERLFDRLSRAAFPAEGAPPRPERRSGRLRVLHVLTEVYAVGGHTRMVWRWMGHDCGNQHSVALTRQTLPPPEWLGTAAAATGGKVLRVNQRPGGVAGWTAALQRAMTDSDLVVLHSHNHDILPFLAIAGLRARPPVALINHCDHSFWLGVGFVDAVVNTRRSGHALCALRRGVAPERNLLLPLCLEGVGRRTSRAEARRLLDLPQEAVVILSVARWIKYRPIGGLSFADALVPLLRANPRAMLVAVGPGGEADWSAAMAAAPGQIRMLPERPDVGSFFESADIYLDSFPFPSNTSMLEAGLHGLPLVTFSPFGPGCGVMGADSLGMDETLVRAFSLTDLHDQLQSLIDDPERRAGLGLRTYRAIETTNTGENWARAIARIYAEIFALSKVSGPVSQTDEPSFDDIDLFTPFVFGPLGGAPSPEMRHAPATELALRTMTPIRRAIALYGLHRQGRIAFRPAGSAWRYMLPEWLVARLRI